MLFSLGPAPVDTPASSTRVLPLHHTLSSNHSCRHFDVGHSDHLEVYSL